MDTEKSFCLNGQLENLPLVELAPGQLEAMRRYVEASRHLQELQALYLVFCFQLRELLGHYELRSSGELLRAGVPADTQADYIAVNGLTTNLLSAGRALADSMEVYCKAAGEGTALYRSYRQVASDVFDHCFAYRFLYVLRNYSQHGHLPVNKNGSWYGFELERILRRPHYKHNGSLQKEMEKISREIGELYDDLPHLSLTMTLAEYTARLLSLYRAFWRLAEPEAAALWAAAQAVEAACPQNLVALEEGAPLLFIYEVADGEAQAIPVGEDFPGACRWYAEEAQAAAERYAAQWEALRQGSITLRLTGQGLLEVGSL